MTAFPDFYDPQQIGTLFYSDMGAVSAAAAKAGLAPADSDAENVQLLLIDMQIDFCHAEGALYVPGAPDDIRRVCEFIFRHAGAITGITATLDSHLPFQIFHPPWWVDADGNHPDPLTIISAADVRQGRWRPVVLPDFSRRYVEELEQTSKKQLTIWPFHVLIGGIGNNLDPALFSVVMWHAMARKTQPTWVTKGRVPQSEHYSAVQPEIDVPGHPQGRKNRAFLESIAAADRVFIAGEAESHCVLETLSDIVREFEDRPEVLDKIYVLEDCMSPVQHPEVDFHALAMEQFEQFAAKGIHFVNSDDDELPLGVGEPPAGATPDPAPVRGLDRIGEWQLKNLE